MKNPLTTLILGLILCTQLSAAPTGFLSIGTHNHHQYFLSNEYITWQEAHLKAQELGINLVSINTLDEMYFMTNRIHENVYIGYADINNDGVYEWTNGDAVDFPPLNDETVGQFGILNEENYEIDLSDGQTPMRFVLEQPIGFIEECGINLQADEILCSEKLGNETHVYLAKDGNLVTAIFDEAGNLLDIIDSMTSYGEEFVIQDSLLIKQGTNGTVIWTKIIPPSTYEAFPQLTHATQLDDGGFVLAGVHKEFAIFETYPPPPHQDSLVFVRTDSDLELLHYHIEYEHETAYGSEYLLDGRNVVSLITHNTDELLVIYTNKQYNVSGQATYYFKKFNQNLESFGNANAGIPATNWSSIKRTPCNIYKARYARNTNAGLAGWYSENGFHWYDNNNLSVLIEKYNSSNSDADIEEKFESTIDSLNLEMNSNYQEEVSPNKMDLYLTASQAIDLAYFPFDYVARTSEDNALIFYTKDSLVHVISTNCIETDTCTIEAIASNFACDDGGTQETAFDDTYTFDLLVTGNAEIWQWGEFQGWYDISTTIGPLSQSDYYELTQRDIENIGLGLCSETISLSEWESCSFDMPDLVPIDIYTPNLLAHRGDTIRCFVDIENLGVRSTEGDFRVTFFLAEEMDATTGFGHGFQWVIDSISPDEQISIVEIPLTVPSNIQYGDFYLKARVDRYNDIEELDETNNYAIYEETIEVLHHEIEPTDMYIADFQVEQTTVQRGQELQFNTSVLNRNTEELLEGVISLAYYFSIDATISADDYKQTYTNIYGSFRESIFQKEFYQIWGFDVPLTIPEGNYYLIFEADSKDNFPEAFENNNTAYQYITIINENVVVDGGGTIGTPISMDSLSQPIYELHLAPNPVQNEVTISLQSNQKYNSEWVIHNTLGEVITSGEHTLEVGFNQFLLPTVDLPKGVYFFQTKTKSGILQTRKFVKE